MTKKQHYTDMRGVWKLTFNHAVKTMTIKEAQDKAWEAVDDAIKESLPINERDRNKS